jgi:hypothetical protein
VSHEKYFPKPNLFCPALHSLGGICLIDQATAELTAQKQNWQLRQPFVPSKETNESLKCVIKHLTLGNHAAMQL